MSAKKTFSDTYITKMGWMVEITDNNTQSDLLAIIYGFTQDGASWFEGGLSYLRKWVGCSKSTVIRHLTQLVDRGILIKDSQTINNITFNRYRANLACIEKLRTTGIKMTPGRYQNDTGGGVKMTPNNTIDNTIDRESAQTKKTPSSVYETRSTLIEEATSQIKPIKQLLNDVIRDIGEDHGLTAMAEAIKFDFQINSRQVAQLLYEVLLERQQKGEILKLVVPTSENQKIVFYMQLFARVRRFADWAQNKKQSIKAYGAKRPAHEPEKM